MLCLILANAKAFTSKSIPVREKIVCQITIFISRSWRVSKVKAVLDIASTCTLQYCATPIKISIHLSSNQQEPSNCRNSYWARLNWSELCESFGKMKYTWLHMFEMAWNYPRLYLQHPPVASTVVCGSSRKSFTCQMWPSKCCLWMPFVSRCLLLVTHKTSTGQKLRLNHQWIHEIAVLLKGAVSMKGVHPTRLLTSSQSLTTAVVNCWWIHVISKVLDIS